MCKAVLPSEEVPAKKAFKVDLGHQEMASIMHELEDIFRAIHECAGPDRPVAIHGLGYNLCASLAYEDSDELEEAIGATLADFLEALPHFKVIWPEDLAAEAAMALAISGPAQATSVAAAVTAAAAASEDPAASGSPDRSSGAFFWKSAELPLDELPPAEPVAPEAPRDVEPRATMLPEIPRDEISGPGCHVTFTVSDREDLWRVVLQGPNADIEIPELEFGIRPKDVRRVDTIYNIIASAVFNLGDHVRKNTRYGSIGEDEVTKITSTIDSLNILLDVEQPFTFVISDPQGVSELKPSTGAHIRPLRADSAQPA